MWSWSFCFYGVAPICFHSFQTQLYLFPWLWWGFTLYQYSNFPQALKPFMRQLKICIKSALMETSAITADSSYVTFSVRAFLNWPSIIDRCAKTPFVIVSCHVLQTKRGLGNRVWLPLEWVEPKPSAHKLCALGAVGSTFERHIIVNSDGCSCG